MPIPDFDHNHVLPPHLGTPVDPSQISPYYCTIFETCQRFATSPQRISILKNYVAFRQQMTASGIITGFQWLNGSFMEDVETSKRRPPNDLDLITFFGGLSEDEIDNILATFPEFGSPALSKINFHLDHYAIDYTIDPILTIEQTRYWQQLFSHNRNRVWKGILQLPLNTEIDDRQSLVYLNSL